MIYGAVIFAITVSPVLIPTIITIFHIVADRTRNKAYVQIEQKLKQEKSADGVGRASQPSMSTA